MDLSGKGQDVESAYTLLEAKAAAIEQQKKDSFYYPSLEDCYVKGIIAHSAIWGDLRSPQNLNGNLLLKQDTGKEGEEPFYVNVTFDGFASDFWQGKTVPFDEWPDSMNGYEVVVHGDFSQSGLSADYSMGEGYKRAELVSISRRAVEKIERDELVTSTYNTLGSSASGSPLRQLQKEAYEANVNLNWGDKDQTKTTPRYYYICFRRFDRRDFPKRMTKVVLTMNYYQDFKITYAYEENAYNNVPEFKDADFQALEYSHHQAILTFPDGIDSIAFHIQRGSVTYDPFNVGFELSE